MSDEVRLINYLMNENFSIIETEQNSQWLLFQEQEKSLFELRLKNETTEIINNNEISVKSFIEAELRFDHFFGKLTYQGNSHILMVKKTDELPSDLNSRLVNWWSSQTNRS